ncbi:LIF receptor subunit alpha b isoform X2 [Electrophorus electricus]|uniref:LIF receptor subunit alpha b isoform X2 n=1 Tax=Electrophorus electricus TaxID=8005 RepID=UPI0015D0A802|nr:LIF receptor subunit alpha b isoform X2 [Electrophorus electricus]
MPSTLYERRGTFWRCGSSQGNLDGHPLSVPEIVRIYKGESDTNNFGVWKMNIEWRDNFSNSNKPENVAYDMEIFHTEQMTLVHNETIEVKTNLTTTYQWSWTSPIPLQCTSHSVRLRFRDHSHTSDWTPLYTLKGEDTHEMKRSTVYPKNHVVLVNDSIIFCCILTPESARDFNSTNFTFQISNHTYATKPIQYLSSSPSYGFDITCDGTGATVYTGYAPDIKHFTCETRDLSSVECHWSLSRSTGLSFSVKCIKYSINGRNCSGTDMCSKISTCVLTDGIDKGVVNWTLTAKNILGKKIVSDVADPNHRVRLKAPVLKNPILVYARNATLEWEWNEMLKYNSFPLTCQVEVNGHTVKGTFNGTSLKSLVLADLQPFTEYTARVRCGSLEHFYKWGDWSNPTTFYTKDDIPKPIDVWVEVLETQICVMWKNLTMSQSHGIITGYELILGSSKNGSKKHINKSANEHYHKYEPRIADGNHFISISAKNSAGVSPPSSVTIPSLGSDSDIKTTAINETQPHGGFYMFWEPSAIATCGYVVAWVPTFRAELCPVKWMKIPSGVSNASIYSDFEKGKRYIISVYACTSGAAQLLHTREGYMKELPPSGRVQNLRAEQQGSTLVLSWDEVPKEEQRGFIQGYTIFYKLSNKDKNIDEVKELSIQDPSARKCKLNLPPGTYIFKVMAFTSAGRGAESEITQSVDHRVVDRMIISIVTDLLISASIFITITVLCYIKREWLKSALYPDIPKPRLSEAWLTKIPQCPLFDTMLTAESEVLLITKPEPYLQVMPEGMKAHEISQNSQDLPQPESCRNALESQTIPSLITSLSYIELPCPAIDNPTYSLTMTLPTDAIQVSDYRPQMQNASGQTQPCVVRSAHMDSVGYQPQSVAHFTSLPFNSVI